MHNLPKLPSKAAYIYVNNISRRNALSLDVLRDLSSQLKRHLRSPASGRLLTLPPFRSESLSKISNAKITNYRWLTDPAVWAQQRDGLPKVLVLRSDGPVFSSGHDLKEVRTMSQESRKLLFDTCAEVMSLIRQSPAVVLCAVQGLATAAGCQLAMTCDLTVARPSTPFQLPGMSIGLPCTSPSTAVSRRIPAGLAYKMFATAEAVRADQLGGAIDIAGGESEDGFEKRVADLVSRLVNIPGQPQAFGKWAYWTQRSLSGPSGDGFQDAAQWASTAMCMHASSEEASEGISSFLDKRKPEWQT